MIHTRNGVLNCARFTRTLSDDIEITNLVYKVKKRN
jgi:hypothetical protein